MVWEYYIFALGLIEIVLIAGSMIYIKKEIEKTIEDESDQLSQDLAKVLTPILEKIDGFLGGNYEAPQQVTPIQSFLMELMKSKMNDQPINATIKDITKDKAGKFIKTEKP
tara:strand:- start:618 stop:950 length:333 start_codon:yes stop_codon:yes gene_type:complete